MLTKRQIKHLCQLKHKKYRQLRQEFLVEGVRICEELVESRYFIEQIFVSSEFGKNSREWKLLHSIRNRGIEVCELAPNILRRFCATKTPSSIVAHVRGESHTFSREFLCGQRFLVLDSIADPGNVGTLLRTADAFGWDGVVLTGQSLEIYNPKLVRASMGAVFRIPISYSSRPRLLSLFKDTDVSYVVTLPRGGDVETVVQFPAKLAVFLGNEAHGIDHEVLQHVYAKISLPMQSHVESLNVSVAGGILLYLLKSRKKNSESRRSCEFDGL